MQNMMNLPGGPKQDTSNYPKFVYVVDGEVAHLVRIPPEVEWLLAMYRSNPIIVEVNPNDEVSHGYIYENGSFRKPTEGE